MIASYFIDKARTKLADEIEVGREPRWSRDQLLSGLNEALQDISNRYHLSKVNSSMDITAFQADYDMSKSIGEINRAEYTPTGVLKTTSRHQMDKKFGKDWGLKTGTPIFLVADETDLGHFTLYPAPDDKQFTEQVLTLNPLDTFGETTEVFYDGEFRTIAWFQAEGYVEDLSQYYGLTTIKSISLIKRHKLKLWYDSLVVNLTIGQNVPIADRIQTAVINYIVHYALLIGNDSENRNLSKTFFVLYSDAIADLEAQTHNSGVKSSTGSAFNNGFSHEANQARN